MLQIAPDQPGLHTQVLLTQEPVPEQKDPLLKHGRVTGVGVGVGVGVHTKGGEPASVGGLVGGVVGAGVTGRGQQVVLLEVDGLLQEQVPF